jgi:hypothetical protein
MNCPPLWAEKESLPIAEPMSQNENAQQCWAFLLFLQAVLSGWHGVILKLTHQYSPP